jgi:hypothetical protein
MNKISIILLLITVFIFSCGTRNDKTNRNENIIGKWYRNSLFAESELTINNELGFSIEAWSSANSGSVTGRFTKIKDGDYFSFVDDRYDSGASCIITLKDNNGKMELRVYGAQVGAGAGVEYDGLYERNKWTKSERIETALNRLIGNYFDKNIVKNLLKDDLEYFTECFGAISVNDDNNKIIIEGWLRGVAPWQNGIIKIENNNIYILFTDCRENTVFRYYSTDKGQKTIPKEFISWYYYKENLEIIY